MIIVSVCCVVVLGTPILHTAVQRFASATMRATGSTTTVFVLCVLLRGLSSPLYFYSFALYPFFFILASGAI
jgi:hypothetical protein